VRELESQALTDWLEILREQTETGNRMARDVPKMLADPDITPDQVKVLFGALEKQAEFAETLSAASGGGCCTVASAAPFQMARRLLAALTSDVPATQSCSVRMPGGSHAGFHAALRQRSSAEMRDPTSQPCRRG
jgi:hypothetical protein